jgi:nitroimidazol reductase NimA-like FMN-containing flavoprotein (pyridoxamine 5'-phosphate oxidase superfamily)
MMRAHECENPSYPVSEINQVKRRHDRGFYDHATVHALLDAAVLCHVSYVIDGQPYCTPTFFWREGNRLYWHGSSASRMLRNLANGEAACLTVTHLDALVLARSGFNHSADYRSVMAFGKARLLEDPQEKHHALVMMVDRLYPQRTAQLRLANAQEIKATSVIAMDIDRASAKIRSRGVVDEEEDYALPVYAERIPVSTVLGQPEGCARMVEGTQRPDTLAGYAAGRPLQDALLEAYVTTYGKS